MGWRSKLIKESKTKHSHSLLLLLKTFLNFIHIIIASACIPHKQIALTMSAAVPGSNPPTVDTVTQGVGDVSLASGPPATGDSKSAAFTTSPQANGVAGASHSAAPSSVPAGSYIVTPVPGGGSQVTPVSPTGSALAAGAAPVAAPSATSPVSPVVGGAEGTAAHPSTLNTAASPTGSRLVSPASGGPAAAPASIAPTDVSAAGSTAAPAAAAVAPVMKEKDIKKYDKLLKVSLLSLRLNAPNTDVSIPF